MFWYNGAASLVVGAWSKTHNKIQQKLYTITFCSYATNFACFIKFWSAHHVPWTIWHLFLGYRGISIIRGKIVAISSLAKYMLYSVISYMLKYHVISLWQRSHSKIVDIEPFSTLVKNNIWGFLKGFKSNTQYF